MTVEQSQTSRLGPVFDSCRKDNRAALIGYLPTGYPDVPTSVQAMTALVESGCDLAQSKPASLVSKAFIGRA